MSWGFPPVAPLFDDTDLMSMVFFNMLPTLYPKARNYSSAIIADVHKKTARIIVRAV